MFQPSGPEHWYLLIRVGHDGYLAIILSDVKFKVFVIFNLKGFMTAWILISSEFWYWYYCGNLEEGFKIKVSHYNLICPFLNLNLLRIINCPLRGMYVLYMCQSVFPCIDWIWSDCCHRQEHRSWLHIKNSADLHRTSCAVLDMKGVKHSIL